MKIPKLIYIGSFILFAERLKEIIKGHFDLQIIDSRSRSVLDCVKEIAEINDNFDAFIIESESVFKDAKNRSSSNGIQLIKHILLREELGDKRKKIIFCFSFFNRHYHLKKSEDNVILFSPYIVLMDMIFKPQMMLKELKIAYDYYKREFQEEDEDFEKNLNHYIIWGKSDEANYRHDYNNYNGIQSLYRELLSSGTYNSADNDTRNKKYLDKIEFIKSSMEKDGFKCDFESLWAQKKRFKHKVDFYSNPDSISLNDNKRSILNELRQKKYNYLLIDDKVYWRDFFNDLLPDARMHYCNTKESALEKIAGIVAKSQSFFDREDISFVLLDLRLDNKDRTAKASELSGIEILRKIKERNQYVPVIVLSASEKSSDILEAYKCGADGYFIKDSSSLFDLIDLINSIDKNIHLKIAVGGLVYSLKHLEYIPQIRCQSSKSICFSNMPSDERFKFIYDLEREINNGGNEENIKKIIMKSFVKIEKLQEAELGLNIIEIEKHLKRIYANCKSHKNI